MMAQGYSSAGEILLLKRLLTGLGIGTMLASPMWLTLRETPSYPTFGICLAAGIVLLIIAGRVKAGGEPRP